MLCARDRNVVISDTREGWSCSTSCVKWRGASGRHGSVCPHWQRTRSKDRLRAMISMVGTDDGRSNDSAEVERGQRSRGLDAGLAKSAPGAGDISVETYRSYRRRLDLFELQCSRRGTGWRPGGSPIVVVFVAERSLGRIRGHGLALARDGAGPCASLCILGGTRRGWSCQDGVTSSSCNSSASRMRTCTATACGTSRSGGIYARPVWRCPTCSRSGIDEQSGESGVAGALFVGVV